MSGKHHPVYQFVCLDAAELLPDYDAHTPEASPLLLLHYSRAQSSVMQKSMSLEYEPSSVLSHFELID